MGILSWFRSRRRGGTPAEPMDPAQPMEAGELEAGQLGAGQTGTVEPADPDEPPSLIRLRYEDPALEEIERAAAEDVARVQQDDKYFHADTPADRDEL